MGAKEDLPKGRKMTTSANESLHSEFTDSHLNMEELFLNAILHRGVTEIIAL